MSAVRSMTRGTTIAAIALMAAATPSSSQEPVPADVGVTAIPAAEPKQMRLACRRYFGCVPAPLHVFRLEKENQ
ncbi:hypothetical protein [Reyranella massiliensis]|uniref:hypothetical protein n=1 Tax=Reyranella massiliensis TaxID=445220 RepID=UPI0002F36502|nr:hypothetical protein [Reyranella massiliensis]